MNCFYVDLLRHGETVSNECLNGSTDVALSDTGWQQLQAATATGTWQRILTSPLQRCAHFAHYLSQEKQWPLNVETDFQEMDFGDWEGRAMAAIDPQLMQRFLTQPADYSPPHSEPLAAFRQRVIHLWQHHFYQRGRQQNTLIVTHSGVIRVLLTHVLHAPAALSHFEVPHACRSRIRVCWLDAAEQPVFSLVSHNTALLD